MLGIINDFTRMAEHAINRGRPADYLDLALWLANTPCSPLRKSTDSPNDEARLILTEQRPIRPIPRTL